MDEATRWALLTLYDSPDPDNIGRTIPGYDRDHADRATRILLLAAPLLGIVHARLADLEVAGLLHDLGRAGLDPVLFGRIYSVAERQGVPIRLSALMSRFPNVPEGDAPRFYLELLRPHLKREGLGAGPRVFEHIRMRMAFKERFREQIAANGKVLDRLGVVVNPWMEKVILYYYYPQDMAGEPPDVLLMGMAQVACENFEALNNTRRGRDYYGRARERLTDVFRSLAWFDRGGLVAPGVIGTLERLAADGALDAIIRESRGMAPGEPLPADDLAYLAALGMGKR